MSKMVTWIPYGYRITRVEVSQQTTEDDRIDLGVDLDDGQTAESGPAPVLFVLVAEGGGPRRTAGRHDGGVGANRLAAHQKLNTFV